MTIKKALIKAVERFQAFDSAQLDAEILLSFALNKTKEFLHAHPESKLNWIQKIRFFYLILRRCQNWPIAYLTGKREFYGRIFFVNKNVLIPRPLTEELIDKTLKTIKSQLVTPDARCTICDIGTGSGNIIITLIKELQKANYDLSRFEFYAVDISKRALAVAKKNARFHQVDQYINFVQGDLLKPLPGKKVDLILANLPYLELTDLTEPSIKKEPKLALLGNYNEFFYQLSQFNPEPILIYEDKSGIHLYKNSSCQNQ